jgi:Na+/H+ antiporter NhaD/arsenite permease-like protein
MALITFLPLGYFALSVTKQEKYMAYLFVLQNISANLGGMLTPFGNPQNLYLYSYFRIPTGEFCAIMLPAFLLAITLLAVACLPVKPIRFTIGREQPEKLHRPKTALYCALFLLSILIVFRVFPFWVGLLIIPVILLMVDRESLLMVDYPLLGTFFFFFIFAGNLARIDVVNQVVSALLAKDTLLVSVFTCQFISNVPSAILLSRFTTDYASLLLGVNIGGTVTLLASLASLITMKFYMNWPGAKTGKFLGFFLAVNLAGLCLLLLYAVII